MSNDTEEQWRPIENFERYMVSNMGNIKSLRGKTKILKPQAIHNGYQQVSLVKDGKKYNRLVHRLVAIAWIDTDDKSKEVHHKNRIKTDNRADNLQWLSRLEHAKLHKELSKADKESVAMNDECAAAQRENIDERQEIYKE